VEVAQLIVGLSPNEAVSAQFELLLTRSVYYIRSGNYLIHRTADELLFRPKFSPVFIYIKIAEFIMF